MSNIPTTFDSIYRIPKIKGKRKDKVKKKGRIR